MFKRIVYIDIEAKHSEDWRSCPIKEFNEPIPRIGEHVAGKNVWEVMDVVYNLNVDEIQVYMKIIKSKTQWKIKMK